MFARERADGGDSMNSVFLFATYLALAAPFTSATTFTLPICPPGTTHGPNGPGSTHTAVFTIDNADDEVILTTPNYPSPYPNDVDCRYKIYLAPELKQPYVLEASTVGALDMEASSDDDGGGLRCMNDFFKFRSTYQPGSEKEKRTKFCGTDELASPHLIYGIKNRLVVHFVSNEANMFTGGQIRVKPLEITTSNATICDDAGYDFTNPFNSLILHSPGYPANYAPGESCTFRASLDDMDYFDIYVLEIFTVGPLNMQAKRNNGRCRDNVRYMSVRRNGNTAINNIKVCGQDELIGGNTLITTTKTLIVNYFTNTDGIEGEAFRFKLTPIVKE